jgi:hypothetical protein
MVVIELGYKKMVMTKERAMMLIDCLEHAEVYETKYWSDEKRRELGMTETYTYHVYPNDSSFGMNVISETHYQMAKLAGKPQEK